MDNASAGPPNIDQVLLAGCQKLDQASTKMNLGNPSPVGAPEEDDNELMQDIMRSIDTPADYTDDELIQGVNNYAERQQTALRIRSYVNMVTHNPLMSYSDIRQGLVILARSCNPPLTIEQARAHAYIEKLRRAHHKDPAARLSLSKHEPRHWNLPRPQEVFLWSWLGKMWPSHKKVALDRQGLQKEITKLSKYMELSEHKILEWIRGTFTAMVKMEAGKVNTTGWTVELVVRAAIDDTPP